MTRRTFLKIALTPIGLAFIGIFSFGSVRAQLLSILKRFEDAFTHPPLEKQPTGALSNQVRHSLLAVVEAMYGSRVEMGHYERIFAWRSENLEGMKQLYERFVAVINST
ncbi:hypothetical protein MJD09_21725, partial [bacterium]|nr:hypothetical protein [bacterium]